MADKAKTTKVKVVMGKREIIDAIARKSDLSRKDAQAALKGLMDTVKETLRDGNTVRLIPFGNFEVRDRRGRTGRNPRTGATITIDSRKVPAFRPGKELKDAVR